MRNILQFPSHIHMNWRCVDTCRAPIVARAKKEKGSTKSNDESTSKLLSRYKRYYQPIFNLNIHIHTYAYDAMYLLYLHQCTVIKSDNEQPNNISSYRPCTEKIHTYKTHTNKHAQFTQLTLSRTNVCSLW